MFNPNYYTHNPYATHSKSGMLDYHQIDAFTLADAVAELNRIVDRHAPVLRADAELAATVLNYENLLIDAQGGDGQALRQATSPEEFDTILDAAHASDASATPVAGANATRSAELDYLALREDLMRYRSQFLRASHRE